MFSYCGFGRLVAAGEADSTTKELLNYHNGQGLLQHCWKRPAIIFLCFRGQCQICNAAIKPGIVSISKEICWERTNEGRFHRNASLWSPFSCLQHHNQPPPAQGGSFLSDYCTLKMEVMCSSEKSVCTRSTRFHISEDGILHSHRRQNIISYVCMISFGIMVTFFSSNEKEILFNIGVRIQNDLVVSQA
jgi:hypothetical protein